MSCICPPSRYPFSAGPVPLYGTWVIFTPASMSKSSVARCVMPPLPVEPKLSLPRFAFA